MIYPYQFRLGNLINSHNGPAEIVSISKEAVVAEYLTEADAVMFSVNVISVGPIPLTEEWLLKLGFTLGGSIDKFVLELNEQMFQYKSNGNIRLWGEDSQTEGQAFETKNIQFVHQLQNLHFALTGEELKVKELA